MEALDLVAATATLLVVLAAGIVIHELSHAVTLRALGITCEIRWLPGSRASKSECAQGTWATVVPRTIPEGLAPWRLRVAALMPLTLAVPIPLVLLGILPDPLAVGDPVLAAATVGWLACALPSPQDFSVAFHAHRLLERSPEPAAAPSRAD